MRRRAGEGRDRFAHFSTWLALVALSWCGATRAAEPAHPWGEAAFATTPADILRAAAAIPIENEGVVVLLDERRFSIDGDGRITMVLRTLYRIDSPLAVDAWSSVGGVWEPWFQKRPRVRARVVTPDGVEHTLDQATIAYSTATGSDPTIYEDQQTFRGPLPAIAKGAIAEVEVIQEDERPMFSAGVVRRVPIAAFVPSLRTRIVVQSPASLGVRHVARALPNADVQKVEANGLVTWTVDQGRIDPVGQFFPNLPPDVPAVPMIEFSTGHSWANVAKDYGQLVEPAMRLEDVAAFVKSIPSSGGTRSRIEAIVQRLHREVRYTGVEFGQSTIVPVRPAVTLRRKFGDCKDKSTLLVAALRASGIDAYLALVNAGPELMETDPQLPGLGAFNHAIVVVPGEPDLWIDATAEFARVGSIPHAVRNRLALIVKEGTTGLTRIPAATPNDHRFVSTREYFVAEDGSARIVETNEAFGSHEEFLRSVNAGQAVAAERERLEKYVKERYGATRLVSSERTPSADMSRPFTMRAEVETLLSATGVSFSIPIYLGEIVGNWQVYAGLEHENEDGRSASASARRRPSPDFVFTPFVAEYHYLIHVPASYIPRDLPANTTKDIGPVRISQRYEKHADGRLDATIRFEALRDRCTESEARAVVRELDALISQRVSIDLDLKAHALLLAGDVKGAIQAYEAAVAAQPKQAIHRIRLSNALLDSGLVERAINEAIAATRLEPKSALAWAALGEARSYAAVGRLLFPGFDRDGAIEAYRRAVVLDPGNSYARKMLALLLAHDEDRALFSQKASTAEAVAEFRELALAGMLSDDETHFEPLGLMVLGRFAELGEARLSSLVKSKPFLRVTAAAVEKGAEAAIREANALTQQRTDAVMSASAILINLRRYAEAAALLEKTGEGPRMRNFIDALSRAKRHEESLFDRRDPRSAAQKLLIAVMMGDMSRAPLTKAARESEWIEHLGRTFISQTLNVRRIRQPWLMADAGNEVFCDLNLLDMEFFSQGNDAIGHRVTARWGSYGNMEFFVIREGDEYLVHVSHDFLNTLGEAAIERLEAQDLNGARELLDWAVGLQPSGSPDDPLSRSTFLKFWSKGQTADALAIERGAHSLLVNSPAATRAIPILLAARSEADARGRIEIDVGLLRAYVATSQWKLAFDLAQRLVEAEPGSESVFRYLARSSRWLGRWDELEQAAKKRLSRLPQDVQAHYALAYIAAGRGDFQKAREPFRTIMQGPESIPMYFNNFAWYSLLLPSLDDSAVDAAMTAYRSSDGSIPSIVHTLACVYALIGKFEDARDMMIEDMELRGEVKPSGATWFVLGIIAEMAGDLQSAKMYYERVQPDDGPPEPVALDALAKKRLQRLTAGRAR